MNRELNFEYLSKLESTKLFKNLGYKLMPDIIYYESNILFKYELNTKDLYQITCTYDKNNNFMALYTNRYYITGGHGSVNMIPLMHPIMKLLEELQIDIEQVYFYKTKGDKDE